MVREFGHKAPVMWRVTSLRLERQITPQHRPSTRFQQIKGGDVVLLHDGGHLKLGTDRSHSVRATDELVRRYLRAKVTTFITVPEMMAGNGAH